MASSNVLVQTWLLQRPIAHRGLFDNLVVPENSLRAFDCAAEAGIPIELDVRLSADGHPVVFHDRTLKRLADLPSKVEELAAAELGKTRLLKTEETIPSLQTVLNRIDGRVPLLVEIKNSGWRVGALEDAVVAVLSAYQGEVAVQSFNPFTLRYLRLYAPSICRGQLSGWRAGLPFLGMTQPDFVAYQVDYLPQRTVTRVRAGGTPLLAWTVSTLQQRVCADAHADNFIFDASPESMADLLGAQK